MAGLTAVWDKTGDASGLFSVQCADLGQDGQDQSRSIRTKARDGAKDLTLARGGRVISNVPGDLGIQLRNLTSNQGQARSALALENRIRLHVAAVPHAGALLDQDSPRNLQVFKFKQLFPDKGIRLLGKRRPHSGKTASINRVRLGAGSADLRKTPCLSRADLHSGT